MINKRRLNMVFFIGLMIFIAGFHLEAKPNFRNVIIISVDTLRADHLGCYGYPLNISPAIDTFSRDGIVFDNCTALTPLTAPSFSTMLSALPPHKHGAKRNGLGIYKKIKILPDFLRTYGYRTAAVISNWPLRKRLIHLHRGFDSYFEVFTKKRYWGIMNAEGQAPAVNRKVLAWLEKNHGQRFFLWVQYSDPHAPYIQHKKFTFDYRDVKPTVYPPGTRMKKIKRYDSEIAYTDFYIGKLLEEFKRLGLYDEALIIFHSDHGESFGEHDYFKHGRKLYNSTLHVPLIIKLPHSKLKNTRRRETASILDIGRTVFSVLGLMQRPHMEGVDLFSEDAFASNRKILLETYGGVVHLKRNSKKFHLKVKPIRYGMISGTTKLIYNLKKETFESYDLNDDPFETKNIFLHVPPKIDRIKEVLVDTVSNVKKYIKVNRLQQLSGNEALISKEDFDRLKSLGYFE